MDTKDAAAGSGEGDGEGRRWMKKIWESSRAVARGQVTLILPTPQSQGLEKEEDDHEERW